MALNRLTYTSQHHIIIASVCLFLGFFSLYLYAAGFHEESRYTTDPHTTKGHQLADNINDLGLWEFVATRDADNYGLSRAQCHSAFPKLYVEIQRSVSERQAKKITYEELNSTRLEDAMVRAMVYNGELHVIKFENMKYTFTRAKATLSSLNRALAAISGREQMPNIEFIFSSEDFTHGPSPIWTYSKREKETSAWLMPDFGYWSWPEVKIGSYREIRRRVAAIDNGIFVDGKHIPGMRFQDKHPVLFWRGNIATAPKLRQSLLDVTHNQSWASVLPINWNDSESIQRDFVPIEDHCRYMFLSHVEGRSYSGRGKYLQNCNSVFVTHELEWREVHHSALVASGEEANYVAVKRDFSDLAEKIKHLINHPDISERIARNSVEVFRDRYLTPAAEACYWRELVLAYGKISDFEATLYYLNPNGEKVRRGVPFESWILDGKLQ
ncbi:hypothetical protein LOZ53_002808 [Ophidiomyces ophidiicola]|nr:hypothetical protein LOZ55_002372 [Ophidiomyces ophidiicola]KAI1981830.1 hypothetical protein LOZ54_005486 [Ophidiomyces ophidiicola]KAI1991616.1 hypothetical protein LOZ53_002808 [Ophidiomyces ophidiicola]KAI1993575.1 hypothetical protein LOZ51_003954 [Ophidiomyces ophidiicola]